MGLLALHTLCIMLRARSRQHAMSLWLDGITIACLGPWASRMRTSFISGSGPTFVRVRNHMTFAQPPTECCCPEEGRTVIPRTALCPALPLELDFTL